MKYIKNSVIVTSILKIKIESNLRFFERVMRRENSE